MLSSNVYLVRHDGVYLPGYSVVVASSEEEARGMVLEILKEWKMPTQEIDSIKLIDTTRKSVEVVWNGDY